MLAGKRLWFYIKITFKNKDGVGTPILSYYEAFNLQKKYQMIISRSENQNLI